MGKVGEAALLSGRQQAPPEIEADGQAEAAKTLPFADVVRDALVPNFDGTDI